VGRKSYQEKHSWYWESAELTKKEIKRREKGSSNRRIPKKRRPAPRRGAARYLGIIGGKRPSSEKEKEVGGKKDCDSSGKRIDARGGKIPSCIAVGENLGVKDVKRAEQKHVVIWRPIWERVRLEMRYPTSGRSAEEEMENGACKGERIQMLLDLPNNQIQRSKSKIKGINGATNELGKGRSRK